MRIPAYGSNCHFYAEVSC